MDREKLAYRLREGVRMFAVVSFLLAVAFVTTAIATFAVLGFYHVVWMQLVETSLRNVAGILLTAGVSCINCYLWRSTVMKEDLANLRSEGRLVRAIVIVAFLLSMAVIALTSVAAYEATCLFTTAC